MRKKATLPPLSEAQLEVMNEVWTRGVSSVADVWKILHERRGIARNTVQTLMARLADKGWLKHREVDGAFFYTATVTQEEAQRRAVQTMVKTVFDGSAEGLVLTLLNDRSLSRAELDRIRQLIADAKRRQK